MKVEITHELEQLRALTRHFAGKEIALRAAEMDKHHRFPRELLQMIGQMDLMGVLIPTEYGGAGLDHLSFAVVIEEIAYACGSTGLIVDVHTLGSEGILMFGNEDQKRKYLPPLARGEKLCAFALTEPESGSDAAGLQTRAVRDGDHYVLNGSKTFITSAGEADVYLLMASTDLSKRARGVSAFIVEKGSPGLSFGPPFDKMGLNGSVTGEVFLDECIVPAENLVLAEGQGFKVAMQALDSGRVTIGAQAVGLARAGLDYALDYARQRYQFGKPITEFQGVQFMLADMATQIEAARLMVYQAATMADEHHPQLTRYASMAKLFATDMAMRVTTDAVQLVGGYGYTRECPVERFMRDAKATQIYEGTNQIQRVVIAREMLKTEGR